MFLVQIWGGVMVNVETARVNRIDVEDKLVLEKQENEPNATLVYTPNLGCYCIDGCRETWKRAAIEEFEAVLKTLFNKEVKITVAD
ncbi:MAG: hypothetical protein A3A13_03685 [Candidatus Yanofskybacteria bacterium RIFCSPLOWO2_01_FULL_43_22]|uniref:Uncharacterized protein n=1 Tax=Candidatus Yanofskybacteria bacterium RIFCSPLOWO2_01_FULL_43_22 TaxID=1802695 RepID=A0A1F8GG24_9BACT|nr:MAG: hypothetical protein A3D48_00240 [Candidatus Yanofskybacteria bacterium RIFCSPHIGHO2_02_FULL_43_17]OGN24253.1 MAG: hypothetical protein A3A13_03685 [Candidatus Yanofskybacteria bacterium RIFCSPLOWO2_01_FULL_43_22]